MKKQVGPASLLAVSVIAILAVAEPASADDQFRHLNGKQIRPKVIGRDPELDIAPIAYFLCSDACRYLTGHTFMADGGAFMWA